MKVGYIRISTKEQNTARQDVLMEQLGVEKVFTDKLSGKNTDRPELQKMMDFVREGDELVVESFSRFARNTRDLLNLTDRLKEKKVRFVSRKESIDTSTPAGEFKTGDWIDTWIEKHKAPTLAPATLTSYRNNYRIHIKPYVGEIPLKKLNTYNIQRMLDSIGGSLSTFVKNYNIIHGALERAVELGMIPRNPCKGVTFPKDDKRKMRVLTKEEQKKFIQALDGEYYRAMFLTYLYTGMRIGEGIPLQWQDIDLNKRTLKVNKKAIVAHDYNKHEAVQVVQDFCKTKSSKRTIAITAGLVSVLKEHKEAMMKLAEDMGEEWSEESLVFRNSRGNMVYSRNLQEVLYRIYDKAEIEGATMHTLRHSYATRCFEAGVDIKAISEQLGHANVKTTYNIYVHLLEDTKVKEIDKLGEIDKFIA